MKALFVESPSFTRLRADYLDDDSFRALQKTFIENPKAGDVIEGVGGLRKLSQAVLLGLLSRRSENHNELRLRQIDSDIERLNKQLAYLHRVRVQYAALVDEQALKSRVK